LNREVKLKELQLLDAARRKFLHFQKQQRESELRRLDDEVQKKVCFTYIRIGTKKKKNMIFFSTASL
jgi:hypothetical protein